MQVVCLLDLEEEQLKHLELSNLNSVCAVHYFLLSFSEGTSYENSLIFTKMAPAGQFSHIRIEARDNLGNPKNYGGDSWRVMIRSEGATLAADVFDFNNGTYEALALLMEPGLYTLDVKLDYTLCDGLRNPPVEWFHKGMYRGIRNSGKVNSLICM